MEGLTMPKGKRGEIDHTKDGIYEALGVDEERFSEIVDDVIESFFDYPYFSESIESISKNFDDKIELAVAVMIYEDIHNKVGKDIHESYDTGKTPMVALAAFKTYVDTKKRKHGWSVEKTFSHYKETMAKHYNLDLDELEKRAEEAFRNSKTKAIDEDSIRYIY